VHTERLRQGAGKVRKVPHRSAVQARCARYPTGAERLREVPHRSAVQARCARYPTGAERLREEKLAEEKLAVEAAKSLCSTTTEQQLDVSCYCHEKARQGRHTSGMSHANDLYERIE